MGLLEAIPLDIQGEGPILAIIPSSLALHLTEFSKRLAPRLLRPLSPNEIKESLSLNHPTSVIPPLGGLFDLEIFLSPLIEQQHSVGFFVESRNTLITLAPSEFRRTFYDGSAIPVPTTPKYRAYASPGRKDNVRCILGVSLENSDFHTSKLITITDWISKHYAESIVMVGDGLHRITLQLDSEASDSETLEHSKWLARDFVYSQLSVFRLNDSRCHFTFVFCSEVQGTARYLAYYGQLVDLFRDDEEFRNSVRAFSLEFLRRKPEREHQEQHVEMSCRYLVEELAIICCLAEDGPSTFVYPGSLTILREIADGKHRSVPACLLRIDYVELKLKSLKK
jgi:tRNA-dependent cyclodipeptide synthase